MYTLRFETLDCLVADGLISMYMDKHASEYIRKMADEAIYEHSPYSQYNRSAVEMQVSRAKQPQARCHNFAPFTFKIPQYCDYCRNFLWGVVQQVRPIASTKQSMHAMPFRACDARTAASQHTRSAASKHDTTADRRRST